MSQMVKTVKTIPQRASRRLRNTPSYFFLLWRWVTWLLALITLVSIHGQPVPWLATLLLAIAFLQTLVITLYAPVFQIFLPDLPGLNRLLHPKLLAVRKQRKKGRSWRPRPLATDEEPDLLPPLVRTRNAYWDIAIYGIDVIICGMVTYYGGYFGPPPFGVGSPFYRYGISTAFVAAFTYRYRGGLAAALGYDLFILFGAFFPPTQIPHYVLNARDLAGSLLDAPVIAILAAYLATLLESYTRSKRREQDNVRLQTAMRRVGETLIEGVSDKMHLLQQSAEQIRKGGHFERLVIALLRNTGEGKSGDDGAPEIENCIEGGYLEYMIPDKSRTLFEQVIQSREKYTAFEPQADENSEYRPGIARLYLPFFREGRLYLVIGAESARQTPFENKQEVFLSTTGSQLVIVLENIRLTEQAKELAALAERGRIAREIHDGVAQLVYMMSLNAETSAALAHRITEASEDGEDKEMLLPLAQRLDSLVTISKQALWETRHYMFTLKPLISGNITLPQMLTGQLREFEAISGLPVDFEIEGDEDEERINGDQWRARRVAQIGTAIFRITQEALTNAYKHAGATQLHVYLRYLRGTIEVEICDNGKGLKVAEYSYASVVAEDRQRIYSGHGMRGMRERAEELGGIFEVKQGRAGGVSVRATLPY
ncbi:MAG: sensor histidine kinase [Chloroflexi bacterium]|nr:MAG: sensor histidine kinase [Chloroflexota bacterium]